MDRLTGWLLGLHRVPLYALVGLIVFAQDALFVGVFPGEIAAILGATTCGRGHSPSGYGDPPS
jgi:membrane-associated protein